MSDEEITIDVSQLKKYKVTELRQYLSDFGLETKGNKAELLERLEKFLHDQEETELLEDEESEDNAAEYTEEDGAGGETSLAQNVTSQPEGESPDEGQDKPPEEEEKPAESAESKEGDKETVKEAGPVKTKISLTGMNQEERVQMRAKRFGNSSEEAKKAARAERFGTSLENGYKGLGKHPPSAEDLEKMKKRGERFGTNVASAMTVAEENEKKKKRIERFGTAVTDLSADERKKARAARFGTS